MVKELCGKTVCKANEECSSCGQNSCNTYTCANPTPKCVANCKRPDLKCVCKPNYHRQTPNGPCVPLQCLEPPPRKNFFYKITKKTVESE